jgi:hypothetical protein
MIVCVYINAKSTSVNQRRRAEGEADGGRCKGEGREPRLIGAKPRARLHLIARALPNSSCQLIIKTVFRPSVTLKAFSYAATKCSDRRDTYFPLI